LNRKTKRRKDKENRTIVRKGEFRTQKILRQKGYVHVEENRVGYQNERPGKKDHEERDKESDEVTRI
jgi:hypothetical protein